MPFNPLSTWDWRLKGYALCPAWNIVGGPHHHQTSTRPQPRHYLRSGFEPAFFFC